MTLEEAIKNFEQEIGEFEGFKIIHAVTYEDYEYIEKIIQLAEWLKILKSAKFEYDEAWRTITHPTPDITYADKQRAQIILDKFRNSLGEMK